MSINRAFRGEKQPLVHLFSSSVVWLVFPFTLNAYASCFYQSNKSQFGQTVTYVWTVLLGRKKMKGQARLPFEPSEYDHCVKVRPCLTPFIRLPVSLEMRAMTKTETTNQCTIKSPKSIESDIRIRTRSLYGIIAVHTHMLPKLSSASLSSSIKKPLRLWV